MPVPNGTAARIGVAATAGGTALLLAGLQGYEYGGEATTTEESFHNDYPSIVTVGEETHDGNFSGRYVDDDDALALIYAAFRSKDIVYATFLINGVGGEEVGVRVPRFRVTSGGVAQAPQYQFSVVQAEEPDDVGNGLFGVTTP